MKLQAKTEEQREHIFEIVKKDIFVPIVYDDCVGIVEGTISFEQMAAIVDYLRQPSDKRKDLFEICWIAYNRKGSKKKSLEQWTKLKDSEKDAVLPHINAYVSSRERQYQKDFERYLRDRTFNDVVLKGNEVFFDPSVADKFDNAEDEEETIDNVIVNGQLYR